MHRKNSSQPFQSAFGSVQFRTIVRVLTWIVGALVFIWVLGATTWAFNLYVPVISTVAGSVWVSLGSQEDLILPVSLTGLLVALFYLRSWRLALLYLAVLGLILTLFLS